MRQFRLSRHFCCALANGLFLLTSSALGGSVTVYFSGTFDSSEAPLIPAGTAFSGSFTYSTADPLGIQGLGFNTYSLISPGDGVFVTTNGFSFSGGPATYAWVANGPTVSYGNLDDFDIQAPISSTNGGNYPGFLPGITLHLLGGLNFLSSNELPDAFNTNDVILNPVPIPSVLIFLNDGNVNQNLVVAGSLSSITAVPEPGSLGPFTLATAVLLCFRCKSIASLCARLKRNAC